MAGLNAEPQRNFMRHTCGVLCVVLALLLGACAQPEKKAVDDVTTFKERSDETQRNALPLTHEEARVLLTASDETQKNTPPLTEKRFYEIMLADIALQRNDPELAAKTFLSIAQETGEPWFAQRATESALAARDNQLLKESLDLWQKLDPSADRPERLRQQLVRFALEPLRQESDAQSIYNNLTQLLRDAVTTDTVGTVFLQLNTSLRQVTDKVEAYQLVRNLALPYSEQAEAHYAVALAAYLAAVQKKEDGKSAEFLVDAEEAIDAALAMEPEWSEALQLKALILDNADSAKMLAWLNDTLTRQPDQKALWPFLARAYVKEKKYAEAREWFLKVWNETGADDALVAAAAISMEMQDKRMTQELLEMVQQSADPGKANELIKTYARIAEDEGLIDEAIHWYQQVGEDQFWWSIQLHIAQLLERAGRINEVEPWLNDLPAVTIDERISVVLARSSFYRGQQKSEKAQALLMQAVKDFPESAELHANLALIEEQQGKVDDAVARLRKALALNPSEPYIQNALGYTLVDHQINIDEGAELIAQALKSRPMDGAILDSMGWALYRQGKTEEALPYLRKAIQIQPDPEVAAHLGEVLWQLGRFDDARSVWKNGRDNSGKDVVIEKTMRRLNAGELPADAP